MKTKIFQIALILTVVYKVRSEDEFTIRAGTFVVSSSGTTRSTHDALPKENKTNMIVSVTNTGDLVEGKINTNISNSTELRAVFASMKNLNVTFQCKILDYVLFEVRFCQKNEQGKEQEQEKGLKQDQQEEPPKGKYNSNIQILQQTHFFGGVWTVRLSIFVRYEATLFTKKAYEVCSRKESLKSLNNLQEVNKTSSTEMSDKKIQAETEVKKGVDVAAAEGNRAQNKEKGANKGLTKLRPFVRPIYIKITVLPKRKIKDLKEGETLYYAFFDFQNQCVVIKAGRFRSVPEARNKTKIIVTGLNLNIEASSEVEGKHTFVVYNNRFKHLLYSQQKDQMSKKANRVAASYSSDAFKNVTMEKQANGTLFVFHIFDKQRNQERSTDKMLVYISHEKKIEEYSVTPPSPTTEEKTSLRGSFHIIKTDAGKRITHENQKDTAEEVRKVESCDICPESIRNWVMEAFGYCGLMNKIATKKEQVVKSKKSSKLITCGTVTFEVSSTDNPEPNSPIPRNIFLLYLNTKKVLNEDGKQIGEEQKSDERQRTMHMSPEDEENTKHALKKIEMLQPVFDRKVQDAVADIKKAITTKFGKDIWDKAEYRSELQISRNVICTGSCQAFIKAVLQYKLIQKAKPEVLQPKEHIKMLLRFHFFAKFTKPQTPSKALMKRLYSPKYRAQKMPMTRQIQPTKHVTKNKPQTSTKTVPESLDQKLRFESAKDKRSRFLVDYSTLLQRREFLEYQMNRNQKGSARMEALRRAQEDKQGKIPNSGYALSADKRIIIVLANCFFLLKL